MAEFLTTSGTSHHIENIIRGARAKLVLISPYLKLSRNLYERLLDADARGVKTTLIFGKNDLEAEQAELLSKFKNLSAYFCKHLHAKCYFNETEMVITSMNMYEFSEKNNREMGILIKREGDAELFRQAVDEAKSIQNAAEEHSFQKSKGNLEQNKPSNDHANRKSAQCIRCGYDIPYDPSRPLCDDCYFVWLSFSNENYIEKYCHSCGKEFTTSYARPLCSSCYHNS